MDETRGWHEVSVSEDTCWGVLMPQRANDLYHTHNTHLSSSSATNTLRNHCPALSCCRSVQLKCEASSVCLPGKTFSTFVVLSKVWSCIRKGTPSTLKIRWRCRLLTCKSSNYHNSVVTPEQNWKNGSVSPYKSSYL